MYQVHLSMQERSFYSIELPPLYFYTLFKVNIHTIARMKITCKWQPEENIQKKERWDPVPIVLRSTFVFFFLIIISCRIFMCIHINAYFLHFPAIHIIEQESDFVIPHNGLTHDQKAGELLFIDISL